MNKVAILVLADVDAIGDLGRVVNAMQIVKEFKEAQDEIQLVFDGAGTKWIPRLSIPDHKYHALYESVKDKITGACEYCASAFEVKEQIQQAGITLLGDYDGHPSVKQFIDQGFEVLVF